MSINIKHRIESEYKLNNKELILKSSGKVVMKINPRYFRPTEVDLLIGDASKAKTNLGWTPKVTFKELVKIMVNSDYNKQKERHGKK